MSSDHNLIVRLYATADWQAVRDISVAAFEPIYAGFERALGHELFSLIYPDWKAINESYLSSLCETEESQRLLVAEVDGASVGFAHYELRTGTGSGEIGINAVHPGWQRRGIATKIYALIFEIMQAQAIKFVDVYTGGDEAHTPARNAYEKCGFVPMPLVHYYKKL